MFSDIIDKIAKSPQERHILYITLVSVSAAVIIMIGALTGFLIPGDDALVSKKKELLKTSNQNYIDVLNENTKLSKRVEELNSEKNEVGSELEKITDYETAKDSSEQDINDVSRQLDELQKQIDEKQSEIDNLDYKIRDMGGKVTLSPGMYTVGKHISAGEYSVKGDGSLLVSDSQNKLKINTRLSENENYTCRLSEGDTIKLETKATFNAG